ncbi:MAG: hypothetical protein MJZ04_03015 [Bacteroidales bacterium]|nr:hypothetical protein [Bacteroidales bacterium]
MKALKLIAAAALALAATACMVLSDPEPKATVTTREATGISSESFTLSGTVEYRSSNAYTGEGGIFFSNKPGVNENQRILSTKSVNLRDGMNDLTCSANNWYTLLGPKTYYVQPGETCYYRAYARIFGNKVDKYILGEEKSFVVPSK